MLQDLYLLQKYITSAISATSAVNNTKKLKGKKAIKTQAVCETQVAVGHPRGVAMDTEGWTLSACPAAWKVSP